jgi:hypothetical protein
MWGAEFNLAGRQSNRERSNDGQGGIRREPTPGSSCKGLRVYVAVGSSTPEPVQPPPESTLVQRLS